MTTPPPPKKNQGYQVYMNIKRIHTQFTLKILAFWMFKDIIFFKKTALMNISIFSL